MRFKPPGSPLGFPAVVASLMLLALILSCVILSCGRGEALKKIRANGQITLITRNNAHCFYEYRGRQTGFEYDLAKAFSEYLGVELKVITLPWNDLLKALNEGKGDFIGAGMTITQSREELAEFSDGYLEIQQQAIVHKHNRRVNEIKDLEGQTIHVREGTTYEQRLQELKREGLDISMVLHEDLPTEELIRMVARKKIPVTIADSNIALLNRRYYPDIRIAFPMEETQNLGWAVKKGETAFRNKINDFFDEIKENGTFAGIYMRYFSDQEIFDYVDLKRYHQRLRSRLPKYKGTIIANAQKYNFDWRLIAAMIYQESHFDPQARSYTGVRGLMQLTMPTAEAMGVTDRLDPEQSIRGGVKYLYRLHKRFDSIKEPDRTLLALASYNVGYGHIQDAREIARNTSLNPDAWVIIEEILPMLRYRRYFQHTRHGYCRGTEPVRYVNRILTFYDILKQKAGR